MTILAKEAVEGCLRRKEEEGEHLKDLPFSLILDSQQGRGEARGCEIRDHFSSRACIHETTLESLPCVSQLGPVVQARQIKFHRLGRDCLEWNPSPSYRLPSPKLRLNRATT